MVFAFILLCLCLSRQLFGAEVCLCDSTSVCDLLCCCDLDCTTDEKESFTCDINVFDSPTSTEVCLSESLFSRITLNDEISVVLENGVYCFSYSLSTDPTSSETKSLKASSIDLQNSNVPFTYSKTLNNIGVYREGLRVYDPVYVNSAETGINRPLTLPAGLRNQCVLDSVLYLRNSTSSCNLKVSSEICTSGSKVDSLTYKGLKFLSNFRNFTIVSTENVDSSSSESILEVIEVTSTCFDNTDAVITCLSPTVDSTNCLNVLHRIDLVVTHTTSLTTAEFNLHLKTVALDGNSDLKTSVSFQSVLNEYPIVGPRYQRYKGGYDLYFNVDDEKSFYTPFEDDSNCKKSREIKFPFSVITSCSKSVNLDSTDFTALFDGLYTRLPKALAKYYNSDLENADEWLQLKWQLPEVLNATNVPTLMEMTIYHKSHGSRIYPENEIVSVTTSVSTDNLENLNERNLLSDEIVFYFSIRFFSVDVHSGHDEHIFDRLSRTFPDYSFPYQMSFGAIAVFIIFALGILIREQGKPEF